VKAATTPNVSGWAWGGSEEATDGVINGNETGLGWISMNNITSGDVTSYGVNIPTIDGNLSGYAWSENVGWIDFNPSTGCPSGACSARREGNTLKGWARIMSLPQAGINAGGWDGWIRLGSEAGDPVAYGVNMDPITGKLSGYGWNGEKLIGDKYEGFGWIDFSGVSVVLAAPTVTLTATPQQIILGPSESLPKPTTLNWIVSGIADSCTASVDWSGSKPVTGGSEQVDINKAVNNFTITCKNAKGENSAYVSVGVGCNENKCSTTGNTCDLSFKPTGSYTCSDQCTTDADCASKVPTGYKELAP